MSRTNGRFPKVPPCPRCAERHSEHTTCAAVKEAKRLMHDKDHAIVASSAPEEMGDACSGVDGPAIREILNTKHRKIGIQVNPNTSSPWKKMT